MELCRREGVAELPLFQCLCGLPALSAWSGSALSHLGGMQSQAAEAIAAGPTSDQNVQALGTNLAKHCRFVALIGLMSEGIKKDLLPHRPLFIDLKTAPSSDVHAQIPSKERFVQLNRLVTVCKVR